jgi:hypothetical protein
VRRAAERDAPLALIAEFDSAEWELITAEVRTDTGRFVNSAWVREFNGRRWWVVVGLHDTIETVIETCKFGLGDSVVTTGELYDRVDRVNRELMASETSDTRPESDR